MNKHRKKIVIMKIKGMILLAVFVSVFVWGFQKCEKAEREYWENVRIENSRQKILRQGGCLNSIIWIGFLQLF